MKRPYTFDDIHGHQGHIKYLKNRLESNTLKHFIILEGPEGLGKTSIADILALHIVYGSPDNPEYKEAYNDVIVNNRSNENIKRFKCSVDGGKDVALNIKDEMNSVFALSRPKVIICDECHGLTESAQDVFLSETEFLNDKIYVIMLTTEVYRLRASLRSRALPIHLEPLKRSEMLNLLKKEVSDRQLKLQNEDATLQMIADWSENKPRTGLNILGAFHNNTPVSTEEVRSLIGYMDIRELVPLLQSLNGSMTFGLSFIDGMSIGNSLISLVTECIHIKSGEPSYKIKMNDISFVREQLQDVSVGQLVDFLYGITMHQNLTKQTIVHAYIHAHTNFKRLSAPDTHEDLNLERAQRQEAAVQHESAEMAKAPSLQELLLSGKIVK